MFCIKCQAFLASFFSASGIPNPTSAGENPRWANYHTVLHRSMRELRTSSDQACPICRSIMCSPTKWELPDLLSNDEKPLEIVLEIEAKNSLFPTLSVTFNNANKAVRLPKRMLASCEGYVKDDELAATLDRMLQMSNHSTGSDASFELANFWLNRCLTHHDKCRLVNKYAASWVPTRLIDVTNDNIRLIETKESIKEGDDRRYLALSHCWGKNPERVKRTLLANYEEQKQNIDPKELSETFRDAIHATRKLGFKYIWIDSLCIIQDSKSDPEKGIIGDWDAEAPTMCDVYRNATMKIAAACTPAEGESLGCFQQRDGLVQLPFLVDVPPRSAAEGDSVNPARLSFVSYGRTHYADGPTVEPPLYGRSWVLQEQLLSPRMLIFDGLQVRWECNSTHGSERTPLSGVSRHIGQQKAIRAGIFNDVEFFSTQDMSKDPLAPRYQSQYWFYTVMDYTHRGMSFPGDRLVAIDGIAQALSRRTKKKYYAGLWEQDFCHGLLWSISHVNEYTATTTDAFDYNNDRNPHVRHKTLIAPSWSWVSVTVPVVYAIPDILYMQRICTLQSVSVSGSPASKTGTIHISGHVRTGYIDAIYPWANRDALRTHPQMTAPEPNNTRQVINYRGRAFSPNDYFVFSDTVPNAPSNRLTRGQNWRLIRGTFRPDETFAPHMKLTFLAIAIRNVGTSPTSMLSTHNATDPLTVWTLALVPTSTSLGDTTFRRVGYAVWEDCAWFGYKCGAKERPGRKIERVEGWAGVAAGLGNLEKMGWGGEVDGVAEGHKHDWVEEDEFPELGRYEKGVKGVESSLVIV